MGNGPADPPRQHCQLACLPRGARLSITPVDRLQAKAAIDARRQEGQVPLSWADTIVLAAKVRLAEHCMRVHRCRCMSAGLTRMHAVPALMPGMSPTVPVRTPCFAKQAPRPCTSGLQTTQELAWREDKISKAADRERSLATRLPGRMPWLPVRWPSLEQSGCCSCKLLPCGMRHVSPTASPPGRTSCSCQGRRDCRRLWQPHPRAHWAGGCHGACSCGPHPCRRRIAGGGAGERSWPAIEGLPACVCGVVVGAGREAWEARQVGGGTGEAGWQRHIQAHLDACSELVPSLLLQA